MTISRFTRACAAAGLALALGALPACSGSDGGKDAAVVTVTGTNDACELGATNVEAGALTLEFTNRADEVSEIYLYNGDDEVVGEVENVPTGATRKLNAKVGGGKYRVTCKPGQAGDGFSERLEVTGARTKAAKANRQIELTASDYTYTFAPVALEDAGVKVGDRIMFEMKNAGTVEHEFEILEPNGEPLGEIGPTKVGVEGRVALTFTEPGTYKYVCGIEGHEAKGMVGTFEVTT